MRPARTAAARGNPREPVLRIPGMAFRMEDYARSAAPVRTDDLDFAAHGVPGGGDHIRAVRPARGWRDRVAPIKQALLAQTIGEDFVAVHMTWGAINEWCTHAGYARLIDRERHPVLTELLERIMRQETRHVAFYVSQARARLAGSRRAQALTRFALRRFWRPVGSGVMPPAETRHLLSYLLAGPGGERTADGIDARIDRLPGLSGLGLLRRATAGLTAAVPVADAA